MILQMPHSFRWGDRAGVGISKTLQSQCTVVVSGLPVMFPSLGASGKLDIFLQHYFDAHGFFYYLHDRVIDATMRII